MKLKLIVLDLDGTLVNSSADILGVFQKAAQKMGLPQPSREYMEKITHLPLSDKIKTLFSDLDEQDQEKMAETYRLCRDDFANKMQQRRPLYDGVLDFISWARGAGYKLAIATNGARNIKEFMKNYGLDDSFDSFQNVNTAEPKPSPEMIMNAMSDVGAGMMETVMVGDTIVDMAAANKAGVVGVGVAWGYHTADDLLRAGAGHIANDFVQLRELIENWQ